MPENFYVKQLKQFIGATVSSVAVDDGDDPLEDVYFGLVFTMPSGKKKALIILQDDEGNGPGSFEIQDIP